MKLKIIRKFCFIIFVQMAIFGYFVCVFFFFLELFGMSQLLVTGYLPQMWTNVTSNIILRPHVVLRDLFYL